MSTVDIDKKILDLLNQVAYRGYVAGQGKDRDDAENLYIQSEIVVERASKAIKDSLKAELLAKMPKIHECDKTCNINSREWIAGHQGYRDAEKNTITEIAKIVKEAL